jgi:GMP synthase-like glutamine amidotransferase
MKDPKALIIQNDKTETLGLYEQYLKEKGIEYHVFHAYKTKPQESFPSTNEYDTFILGPTPISANEINEHEFLVKEWICISELIKKGKPCLGVCFGAQILAKYLGAKVIRSPETEIGGYEVQLTEQGKADPLFTGFPAEFFVFHWHSDMFKIPPGGNLLVKGDPCPIQAFGWRNVRGVLFHLEIDRYDAERWAATYPDELDAVGKTKEQAINECREREPEMRKLAHRLMANFLNNLL